MSFRKIKFGMADAERERSDNPKLLIEGFLDEYGYIDEVINGNKFLVLGPKGSGKSAIASKIELTSKNLDSKLFVKIDYLESFPYKAFTGIFSGTESPEIRFPNHWEFILLIALCNSFHKDKSCKSQNDIKIETVFDTLKKLDLLPSKTLTDIVKVITTREFKTNLPKILELNYKEEVKGKNIDFLWTNLKELCYNISANNKHMMIIDGLDDVLTRSEKQYKALSALVLAADRINKKFNSNGVKSKIVILCRTDLFDKLETPNNNKIIQDSGIILNWYQDTRNVYSTNLIKLINLRAKIALNKDVDVFQKYLPRTIINQDETVKTLLENTRHTPRDFIMLLSNIQKSSRNDNPSKDEIMNGIRNYSIEYFVPEIRDELVGYITTDEKENIFKILTGLNRHRFKIEQLEAQMKKETGNLTKEIDLYHVLETLYNCSAISNVAEGNAGEDRYTSRYRNRFAKFNVNEEIQLHRALQKGLNITG